jgi:hypothetical protein
VRRISGTLACLRLRIRLAGSRGYPGSVCPPGASTSDADAVRPAGLWNVPAAIYAAVALAYALTLAGELERHFSASTLVAGLAITAYPAFWAWGIRRLHPCDPALRVRSIDLLPSVVHGGLGLVGVAALLLTHELPLSGARLTLAFFGLGWLVPLLGLQRFHRSARLLVVAIVLPLVLLVSLTLAP